MYRVESIPYDPYAVIDSIRASSSIGATVSFIGSLRGQSADGKPLRYAECEGDQEAVERFLRKLESDVRTKWQLEDIAICHRVGRIEVGDVIMVVAIAARHRPEAFEACQYAVDQAKDSIVIREVI